MNAIRWIGVVLLVASVPLALWLPLWTSFENGPVETSQALLLLVGAGLSLRYARVPTQDARGGWFWLAAVPFWIGLALRELSWGAVFLAPQSIGEHGPQFSSHVLWYKPFVAPVMMALLVLAVVSFLYGRGIRRIGQLIAHKAFPFGDFGLFILAMLVSSAAEGHVGSSLYGLPNGQVTEEIAEFAAYMFLFSAQCRIFAALGRLSPRQ
ncbi:hypothetical protein [Thioclava sp. GXIMD2076]|uniref:Uncharacterized protein n=1 Tax=Thioclava kandeliae TaxID=3070818 RepID=A0ABV1SBC5_9RHOB